MTIDSRLTAATEIERQTSAVVVVPMQPPVEVNVNWHGSWRQRARSVRDFREQAGWATKKALSDDENGPLARLVSFRGEIVLDAEIRWQKGRNRVDHTNAGILLKAAIDGLSDVLWAGEDKHVELGRVSQIRGGGTVTFWLRALVEPEGE